MKSIELKFDINERVKIKEFNIVGTVVSIWITTKNIKYEVRYFSDYKPQEVYFHEEELEETYNKDNKIEIFGFKTKGENQ
jgi:uncharacterized protein YodC (DUF2158 family)